jgi:hypothetical protein
MAIYIFNFKDYNKLYIQLLHPHEKTTITARRKKNKIIDDIIALTTWVVENRKIVTEGLIIRLETETDTEDLKQKMQQMLVQIQTMQKKLEILEKEKVEAKDQTTKLTKANETLTKENEILRQEITLLTTYNESDEKRENKRQRSFNNSTGQLNETIKKLNVTSNISVTSNKNVSFRVLGQTSTPNNRNPEYNKRYNDGQRVNHDNVNSNMNTTYVTVIKGNMTHEKIKCEPKIKTFAIFKCWAV